MALVRVLLALVLCVYAIVVAADPKSIGNDGIAFGNDAISSLGSEISRIAREHNFDSETKLRDLLLQDKDLGVDRVNKKLVYACSGLLVVSDGMGARHLLADHHHRHHGLPRKLPGMPTSSSGLAGTSLAGRQLKQLVPADMADPDVSSTPLTATGVPLLHSRPSSIRKIFLDFDGHTTIGAAWNRVHNRSTITTPPYDTDGNPSSFSAVEKANIYAIWRAVAEDYAVFDVDVTTEDPGDGGLTYSGSTDTSFGMRVAIGGSSNDWYGAGAGGVAYVGVFNRSDLDYQPAYVFPAQLSSGFPKYVWEAVSHEVGHTLGLNHDGNSTSAYYYGHGDWGPIMGASFDRPISQWSKGEYSLANQKEDDIAMIASKLSYIADDYGNTAATAAALPPGTSVNGIISYNDVDVFSVQASEAGYLEVTASVVAAYSTYGRSDLDILLKLADASGTVLATADTLITGGWAGLPAILPARLPAVGTYYISVSRTGTGNPLSTGYSDYASMGQYTLKATFTPGTGIPDPVPTIPLALAATKTKQKGTLDVTFTDRSTNEALFRIERCQTAACTFTPATIVTSQTAATTGTTVTWRDANSVRTGTSYSYRVQACTTNGAVCSAPSKVVTGTA